MHKENCFITLTYSDENLKSEKLQYEDFQKFMKRLRRAFPNQQIGCFVTGEYGDQTKRPHWHACIFGWRPSDAVYKYSNDRGDKSFSSVTLERLWQYGIAEFGNVTIHSAGYCARYAAKKLCHGIDQSHDFHPISKKSSKHAIGKRFLESHWQDIFTSEGAVILFDGTRTSVPRYYEKWLQKHQPEAWERYVTQLKLEIMNRAQRREEKEIAKERLVNDKRGPLRGHQISKNEVRYKIQKQKFDQLQSKLKL